MSVKKYKAFVSVKVSVFRECVWGMFECECECECVCVVCMCASACVCLSESVLLPAFLLQGFLLSRLKICGVRSFGGQQQQFCLSHQNISLYHLIREGLTFKAASTKTNNLTFHLSAALFYSIISFKLVSFFNDLIFLPQTSLMKACYRLMLILLPSDTEQF